MTTGFKTYQEFLEYFDQNPRIKDAVDQGGRPRYFIKNKRLQKDLINLTLKFLDSPRLSKLISESYVDLEKFGDVFLSTRKAGKPRHNAIEHFPNWNEKDKLVKIIRIILQRAEIQFLSPEYQLKLVENRLFSAHDYFNNIDDYVRELQRNNRNTKKQPLSLEAIEIGIKEGGRWYREYWKETLIILQDLAAKGKFPGFV